MKLLCLLLTLHALWASGVSTQEQKQEQEALQPQDGGLEHSLLKQSLAFAQEVAAGELSLKHSQALHTEHSLTGKAAGAVKHGNEAAAGYDVAQAAISTQLMLRNMMIAVGALLIGLLLASMVFLYIIYKAGPVARNLFSKATGVAVPTEHLQAAEQAVGQGGGAAAAGAAAPSARPDTTTA